jgi:hypothetical protein
MKKIYIILFICFFIVFNLQSLAQIITIGTGSAISAISPHNHATAYSVTEILYLQSEINTNGFITALAFEKSDGTNLDSITNVKIFLTHTTATNYVATTFDTAGAGYVEVYSGSFPNNDLSGWMEVQLQTYFIYDNINNLQVLFLKTNSPTNTISGERARYRYSVPGGNRVRRYNSDTPYQVGVTSLTTTNFTSNIRLTIAPPAPPSCPVLFSPTDNATEICPADPIFTWSTISGPPASDYEFYLGTDGGGSVLPTDVLNGFSTGNVLNYNYNGTLSPNTTYYWSVISSNLFGNASGCAINSFTTGNAPPVLSVAGTPNPLLCYNDSASVTALVSGGTTPYSYQWSTGHTTVGVAPLGVGSYSVTVTDSISCSVSQNFTITAPPAIDPSLTSTPDSLGNCNGTVSANPSGGTPPYTISWSSGNTSNLCTGWYTATITDANGCEETDSVFVDLLSGIKELDLINFSVYPNPASDKILISLLNNEIGEIKVYNITGELVKRIYSKTRESELIIEELNPGMYFIEILNNRIKIVKQ